MLVDVFGADHGGYLARMYSAMKSLGYDTSKLNFSLVQIVRLFKGGEEFKMSKRTGNAIAMNDLINEVFVTSLWLELEPAIWISIWIWLSPYHHLILSIMHNTPTLDFTPSSKRLLTY